MPRQRSTTTVRSVRRIRRRPAFEPLEPRCLLAAIAMTDDEQLVIEMINRARANPAAEAARLGIALNQGLPPATLTDTPKQPLAPHQLLIDTAAAHSQDMVDREFFDHVNPDGEDPGERLAKVGLPDAVVGREHRPQRGRVARPGFALPQSRASAKPPPRQLSRSRRGHCGTPDHSINMTELLASRSGNVFLTGVAFSDRSDGNKFFSPGEGLDAVTITATGRNRGTVYTTITGPTGGYSLQVPTDTYDLTASNGELTDPIQVRGVAVGAPKRQS